MKVMFISDLHGSYYWANRAIEKYHEEKADKLIILGDILYHGPRNDLPKNYNCKKVIALLNPLKKDIIAVRGNCDSEVDQIEIKHTAHSREGFALGAVIAAEWLVGKKGVFTMKDVLGLNSK